MAYTYLDILTTDGVKEAQSENGAREQWENLKTDRVFDHFDDNASAFIAARDSFYMASVSSNGWPYMQHRGGPTGFLKILDNKTIGFADYSGNRQYISLGNSKSDDRVALFLMDYPRRKRMKMMAHLKVHNLSDNPQLAEQILDSNYVEKAERLMTLSLVAYDWNCPQYITPRYTKDMVDMAARPLQEEIARLQAENEALRAKL